MTTYDARARFMPDNCRAGWLVRVFRPPAEGARDSCRPMSKLPAKRTPNENKGVGFCIRLSRP
jgi:hypothetical protein